MSYLIGCFNPLKELRSKTFQYVIRILQTFFTSGKVIVYGYKVGDQRVDLEGSVQQLTV